MKTAGVLDLSCLNELARNDSKGDGIWVDTDVGKKYSKEVSKIIPADLAGISGFYFWVSNANSESPFLYIGQSLKGLGTKG